MTPRELFTDILFLLGLALAAVGVGLIYLPAGVIVGGLALAYVAHRAADAAPIAEESAAVAHPEVTK